MAKRIIGVFLGVIILGTGSALFKVSALGHDSLGALLFSVVYLFDKPYITYFICYVVFNLILFIPMLIFDRKVIGIANFISIFVTGLACDLALYVFGKIPFLASPILFTRIICSFLGLGFIAFGISLYGEAALGINSYDELPRLIIKLFNKASYKVVRVLVDLTCTIIAFIIGNLILGRTDIISINTIVSFVVLGPLIGLFSKLVNKYYYHKENGVFE